jgi:hypothetical protein
MAKTHRDLWESFVSRENFDLALKKALRHKKKKRGVLQFLAGDVAARLEELRLSVIRGGFSTSKYRQVTIFEPKKRDIFILPFYPDCIIHHALMNVLAPIWHSMFFRDSYACRPGMGIHVSSRRVMGFIRRNKYVLQCDIRKFYPSISHDILFGIISRKIADERLLKLVKNIVYSIEVGGPGLGIPIGNLSSQWFGNLYMNELDSFVKHELRCRDYIRYCDDFCLFSDDKDELRSHLDRMRAFLAERLGLGFSYAEIFPTGEGLDYLGYRHFPDFVLIRKSTALRIRKRIGRIKVFDKRDPYVCGQVASANGWTRHANAYNFRKTIFANFSWIAA